MTNKDLDRLVESLNTFDKNNFESMFDKGSFNLLDAKSMLKSMNDHVQALHTTVKAVAKSKGGDVQEYGQVGTPSLVTKLMLKQGRLESYHYP